MLAIARAVLAATKVAGRHPRDPALADLFGVSTTASGQRVTSDTAMTVSAVYACVRVIAEAVASLPLFVYMRTRGGGKTRAFDHPLYELLHDQPNRWQTSFEFREMMQAHLLLRGNAYAVKQRTGIGITELVPLHPDRVLPFIAPDGKLAYMVQARSNGGESRVYLQDELLHLRGLSSDGYVGQNPIQLQRETIGHAMAATEYGARFFANDATPRGVIVHPSHFTDEEAVKRFREAWKRAYSGENRHSVAVLEDGLEYKDLGMTNKDSQFLESRQFSVTDIARIFRVPPHMIADLDKATFSNIEQQSLEFVIHTLRPWLVRWEQALRRDLLTPRDRRQYFVQFAIEGLLRGDTEARSKAYAVGRQWGWLSVNDVRRLENMNPVRGGDEYLRPLNMQPIGAPAQQTQALLRAAAERVARKEAKTVDKYDRDAHVEYVQQVLGLNEEHAAMVVASLEMERPPFDDDWVAQRTEKIIKEVEHALSE